MPEEETVRTSAVCGFSLWRTKDVVVSTSNQPGAICLAHNATPTPLGAWLLLGQATLAPPAALPDGPAVCTLAPWISSSAPLLPSAPVCCVVIPTHHRLARLYTDSIENTKSGHVRRPHPL